MAYTVVDLIDKFILIEQNGHEMYMKMAAEASVPENIKLLAKVFAREEKHHIEVYMALKEKVKNDSDIEIDFQIYDKASKLVSEFMRYTRNTLIKDTKEMLEFCLNFEKENLALLVSIQGVLVNSQSEEKATRYKVLSELIKEEQKHIQNITAFTK